MKNTLTKNWYKEFAQISTRLEGVIRCSYLALFDAEDNFLFSIQSRYHKTVRDTRPNAQGNFVDNSGVEYNCNGIVESDGAVAAQFNINEWCTLNRNGLVEAKQAAVIANQFVDAEKVPVMLTEAVRLNILDIVKRQIEKMEQRRLRDSNAGLQYNYAQRFLPMLEDPKTVYYVYWWQCRWFPTNVMNGQTVVEEIEKKYEATERLARILAAASGITLFT